ncbi:uncharacterized protein LOC119095595 [Pollicipes pollicipes]|uniref:uncharacterized protein LOC119095595 n=1 Tax=Pollicipes pollicipes TaxID=41117 RepID=UPI00188519BB|nr:uncharacterized protein LOC119095595 [Pollicipes pollicipes]
MLVVRFALLALCCGMSRAVNFENMQLFERLGLGRTVDEASPRIRSLKTPGNSPMFVIRLPPSPYYYLNHVRGGGGGGAKPTAAPSFARVPLDFTINGKPDRLYHYNLGVTPPMVDETTTTEATTTTSTSTTTTTPRPKVNHAQRLRHKYADYYKGNKAPSAMKKYKYAYNGKPSSFYVMRGSSARKPVYFRRFV